MSSNAQTHLEKTRVISRTMALHHPAGIPVYDPPHEAWRIPVWLSYPGVAPLGPVGELCVDAVSGEVQPHTPLAQMKTQALRLCDQHRATIDAPLS